tara:strand:+ start:33334 stop:34209 length:876 start_codon:yes stop_codon:yes gene_type:complete
MRFQAEKLASITPNLSIKANKLANTVWEGIHNRNKAGIGENFWQFKKYEYGDPIHLIDWKKSAKSENIFIQEQELSTIQNINIWRDTSNSMKYSSNKNIDTKINIADLITLTLSIILIKNGERVRLNSLNSMNFNGEEAIKIITNEIKSKIPNKFQSNPNIEEIKNGSTCIFISDFLYNTEITDQTIKNLSSRNISGLLIHITDPAEKNFPYSGRINFNGLEGEDPYLIGNANAIKKDYIGAFNTHSKKIKKIAQSFRWNYFMHVTNENLVKLMIKIYFNLLAYKETNIEK